jgi:D-alanyl-D-alanine carboxypeptidase (penicillin-binding protein 5/6)
MKMRLKSWLAMAYLLGCAGAWGQMPQPPEIAARAYIVLDITANQILAAKDIDMAVEPGSTAMSMSLAAKI